jgi:hypothetical protein
MADDTAIAQVSRLNIQQRQDLKATLERAIENKVTLSAHSCLDKFCNFLNQLLDTSISYRIENGTAILEVSK